MTPLTKRAKAVCLVLYGAYSESWILGRGPSDTRHLSSNLLHYHFSEFGNAWATMAFAPPGPLTTNPQFCF